MFLVVHYDLPKKNVESKKYNYESVLHQNMRWFYETFWTDCSPLGDFHSFISSFGYNLIMSRPIWQSLNQKIQLELRLTVASENIYHTRIIIKPLQPEAVFVNFSLPSADDIVSNRQVRYCYFQDISGHTKKHPLGNEKVSFRDLEGIESITQIIFPGIKCTDFLLKLMIKLFYRPPQSF